MRLRLFNTAWWFSLIFWGLLGGVFCNWGSEIGPMFLAHSRFMVLVFSKLEMRDLANSTRYFLSFCGFVIGMTVHIYNWKWPWKWRWPMMLGLYIILFLLSMIISFYRIRKKLIDKPEILIAAKRGDEKSLGGVLNKPRPSQLL